MTTSNDDVQVASRSTKHQGERRREIRYAAHGHALVRALSPVSEERLPAKVLDLSKKGMKLHIGSNFAPGTKLQVFLKKTFFLGEVRYSRPSGNGFVHGIQIEDSFTTDK